MLLLLLLMILFVCLLFTLLLGRIGCISVAANVKNDIENYLFWATAGAKNAPASRHDWSPCRRLKRSFLVSF